MAFPSNPASGRDALKEAGERVAVIKRACELLEQQAASDGLSIDYIFNRVIRDLRAQRLKIAELAAVAGFAQAATDAGFNGPAEANNVINALQALEDWIGANLPKDGSGFLLGWTLDEDNNLVPRVFTPAQLGGFINALQAVQNRIS